MRVPERGRPGPERGMENQTIHNVTHTIPWYIYQKRTQHATNPSPYARQPTPHVTTRATIYRPYTDIYRDQRHHLTPTRARDYRPHDKSPTSIPSHVGHEIDLDKETLKRRPVQLSRPRFRCGAECVGPPEVPPYTQGGASKSGWQGRKSFFFTI